MAADSPNGTRLAIKVDIVVIGAGQAGLSSAYHLRGIGLAPDRVFVTFDQSPRPGGAWQFRWPSLTLATANRIHDLPGIREIDEDGLDLMYGDGAKLYRDDVPWLVEQAISDVAYAPIWAELVTRAADLENATHTNAILEGAARSPALRDRFAWALEALDLNAPESRMMKAAHLRNQRRAHRARARRESRFTPTAPAIQRLLSEIEAESGQTSGNSEWNAFSQLIYVLRFEPDGQPGVSEYVLDIPELPGWTAANAETRLRIIAAAKKYLRNRTPDPEPIARQSGLHRSEVASYMAFRLLNRNDPAWLDDLEGEFWEHWLPTIVAVEAVVGKGTRDLTVLKHAQQVVPQAFADAFVHMLKWETERDGRAWVLDSLKELLDEEIIARISVWLPEALHRPHAYRALLRSLLEHGAPSALNVAIRAVPVPLPQDEAAFLGAVESARALLAFAPEEGWPVVWAAIQADRDFASAVLVSSRESLAEMRSFAGLSSDHLADLYIWLATRDEASTLAHAADERWKRFDRFENRVLDILTGRSDLESIAALHRIARSLPGRRWLRRTIRRVEGKNLEETWVAPSPADVLALDGHRHNRLVRNDEQLAAVILESLGRLQERLHGPNPPTFGLWNQLPGGKWRPKEEERLSDFIADHLRRDLQPHGVVVNREVEIRAKQGGAPGEIPDLLVSASVFNAPAGMADIAAVVVEVKGCWHREVLTAMESQLAARYLETSGSRAGIYCVGWYRCLQWDRTDPRQRATPEIPLEDLRRYLEQQAQTLSNEDRKLAGFVLETALR